jgi:hypothetical protein
MESLIKSTYIENAKPVVTAKERDHGTHPWYTR